MRDSKVIKKLQFHKEDTVIYTVLLVVSIVSCIIRYPDFDTALWSASDTNYQCLMNAKAMLEADEEAWSFLPLITFSEDTDYGLEYSSGAFDLKTGKYFYYVSFPAFPFTILAFFFKVTGLAVNETSLYLFCSILFCISVLVVVRLFMVIFKGKMEKSCIAFVTGATYLFSVEIMHSQGLTYWGQNWYMIFFPVLCMAFFRIEQTDKLRRRDYGWFFLFGFLLLQTEWSGYFALFAFWSVSLFRLIKRREKKYLYLVVGMAAETILSALAFVLVNAGVVGFSEFIDVITSRAQYRSRTTDFAVFAVEKSLSASFGGMIVLLLIYAVWRLIHTFAERHSVKSKWTFKKEYTLELIIFLIPLMENHIFTEHAMRYSMDRMKWYFILNFILLFIIAGLSSIRYFRTLIFYSTGIVMGSSLFLYLFTASHYLWKDTRLKASVELKRYIEEEYCDSVMGQLGNENVWGYSKILFGHGIVEKTSINNLIERAKLFHKRYAVALNDLELSYTQKWYSSAIIYDSLENDYRIAGSLDNSYRNKIDDLAYLEYSEYVDLYVNSYDNFAQRISFSKYDSLSEKEEAVFDFMKNYRQGDDIIYFASKAEKVPNLTTVYALNWGEWAAGISASGSQLLFLNSEGNRELLQDAKTLVSGQTSAKVKDVFVEENYIFVEVETDNISDFSYPNAVKISYEENME